MHYVWQDYDPNTMGYVENWLDENAVKFTGLDEGFRNFYEYWANEDGYIVGENFWCKIVCENDRPFAVIAFCRYEEKVTIMEIVVAPEKRGQGSGSSVLEDLLKEEALVGADVPRWEAVIFLDNIASQKAFENAGFRYDHSHEDGTALYYVYKSHLQNSV